MKMKNKRILQISAIEIFIILISGCVSYTSEADFLSLDPSGLEIRETGKYYLIKPAADMPSGESEERGVIFYPGGLVRPDSYIPLGSLLVRSGATVFIVKMPFDLAVFAPYRAEEIRPEFSGITEWIIGGHSLGGVMAVKVLYDIPEAYSGLFLLASYPAAGNNISDFSGEVLSIYGTEDTVLSPEGFAEGVSLLPASTVIMELEGGNHAQFGNYGFQKGDSPAEISSKEQQELTASSIIDLLYK
ncbi:MAG: alpha/beta hydrolase [Spirochaetales bacterium]|nr:alpha/beta hydrolase [Spirochaetales bacterium]